MNATRKGSLYRKVVQDALDEAGFSTTFRAWLMAGDDITAIGHGVELSIEVKDHKKFALASFVDQARKNARPDQVPVVFVRRKGKPGHSYVVMDQEDFTRLLQRRGNE